MRWSYQLLMTVLLSMTSLLPLAGCASESTDPETDKREAALQAIRDVGGRIKFADQASEKVVLSISITAKDVDDEFLAHLQHFPELEKLSLTVCFDISDEGLIHLRELKNLRSLDLGGNRITDAGLKPGLSQVLLNRRPVSRGP
jgi:hypothetical protein